MSGKHDAEAAEELDPLRFSRVFFHLSLTRFTRRTNSAKLGRPILASNGSPYQLGQLPHPTEHYRTFQFAQGKCHRMSPLNAKEAIFHHYQRKSSTRTSTSTSKTCRENHHHHHHPQTPPQPMTVTVLKGNNSIQVSLSETPNLLRRYTTETRNSAQKRLLWRGKPQITL